ncbi:hypothetical protein [Helicobacter rodentium]|uniref:hypothetical protein n=1 Tax=Helicobacter rodentium TaxID=59617 RepID=UPI0023F344DC|nr:hypothetical protein [Helicobacter rodentium]
MFNIILRGGGHSLLIYSLFLYETPFNLFVYLSFFLFKFKYFSLFIIQKPKINL